MEETIWTRKTQNKTKLKGKKNSQWIFSTIRESHYLLPKKADSE